jgi:cell division protein YceG involved in septum cleavage
MICNNYSSPNGIYTQRGCRCNLCQLVQDETKKSNCYQSAHTKNIANDFTVQGMRTEQARQKIIANKHLLPYPVRLEKDVKWLHIDGYDINNGEKITMFTG